MLKSAVMAVLGLATLGASLEAAPPGSRSPDEAVVRPHRSLPSKAYELDTPDLGDAPTVIRFDLPEVREAYLREYALVANEQTASELDEVEVPDPDAERGFVALYPMSAHTSLSELAAQYWGLAPSRVAKIKSAGDQPDVYQSGLDNTYNQQWSHAFLLNGSGTWFWGDADDDFHDNLNGDSGEWESPEGLNGKSAKDYYQAGNQQQGDWYLGYATHYIEDVNLVVHTSFPSRLDLLSKHFAFEDWIAANLTSGHRLLAAAAADTYYYAVTDPKASINNAAYFVCYGQGGVGKRVWDAYVASGYPTGAGTGSSTLVSAAKEMMIRAARYTRGTIKYALDRYGQWSARY